MRRSCRAGGGNDDPERRPAPAADGCGGPPVFVGKIQARIARSLPQQMLGIAPLRSRRGLRQSDELLLVGLVQRGDDFGERLPASLPQTMAVCLPFC